MKGWSWNTYFEARLAPAAANRYVPGLPTTNSVVLQMHPQSAVIEGGTYFPIVYDGTAWRFRGGQYAGFWAPLVKFGFQRVPARDKDLPDNLDVRGGNADWSYSGGLRLGIWGVPTDLDAEGPELLTYVDLTVGQWQNFRPWGCTELKNGGCAGSYRLYETGSYHRRFEATGRLRVPATPFTVGFTVNTGPGPDDVRFFFGSRFDLAKFLRAVVPPLSK